MSYFYLKPIQGNVSLHILEECVLQRWNYFLNASSIIESGVGGCQYIIEGSTYDNIGHFTLSYLSLCSENQFLINKVLKHEEDLFYRRLTMGTPNSLRLLCKYILKFTRQVSNNSVPYIEVLEKISRKLILKHIANHVLNREHSSQCNIYNVECHFTHCLNLIRKRQVEIKNGIVSVPCGRWILFFKDIFRMHLHHRNNNMNKDNIVNVDPRCREIIFKLTQTILCEDNPNGLIGHQQVDDKAKYFPLCMRSLHNTLRTKHRLTHNDRFRYSLFLKDIGMSMQQSIHFWQQEYSKSSLHHSACCHSWEKDHKKYIYGIRHLYGLEGSRKKYSMVGCKTIQNTSSNQCGCPFKHHDKTKLQSLLDSNVLTKDMLKEIQHFIDSERISEACTVYKNAVLVSLSKDSVHKKIELNTYVFSPVDYFNQIHSTVMLENNN